MHRLTVEQEIENCEEVLRNIDSKIERLQTHKKGLEEKLAKLRKGRIPSSPTSSAPTIPSTPPRMSAGAALFGNR